MLTRKPHYSERVQRIDPTTGTKVIQLTSYPLPSAHFYYDWPSVTPDNQSVLVYCQRFLRRGAPWDIFRVDTDGLNMFQLTEFGEWEQEGGYYGRPWAVLTLDGEYVYVNADHKLHRIEMETGKAELIADLEPFWAGDCTLGRLTFSSSGQRVFVNRTHPIDEAEPNKSPQFDWITVDLATGTASAVEGGGTIMGCAYDDNGLIVSRGNVVYGTKEEADGSRTFYNKAGKLELWLVDEDGSNGRRIGENIYAHGTNLGRKGMMQGCGLPPHRCIWIGEPEKEPVKLVQGPYFWHSGASFDSEWIVGDTNWPDAGLQLVHVPSAHFRTLCHPGATRCHVEYGHPHPSLSQDGRIAVFRSDRTNASQVYVAHVSDEFRESVIAGELDHPTDKWM
jgi:oligogalacturonide lyase